MGYYSHYSLIVKSDSQSEIIEELRNEYDWAKTALTKTGSANESCTWYENEEDMMAFSKKHPGILFEMLREGEDSGDNTKTFYKNGKMQKSVAKITHDEFDESKLE